MADALRVLSWNVNGVRACAARGLGDWLEASGADVVGLQEVRASEEETRAALQGARGWHIDVAPSERAGYAGVALLSRRPPDALETGLGERDFDREGRVQVARWGRFVLANVYFPNGSGKERDNGRVPYKLDFYRRLHARLERLRRGGLRVLVVGDFNTAHREIDLARPRDNLRTSGFLPEERAEIDRWLASGWVDAFRRFEPGGGHYTWWSQRLGVRARNVGWRIDCVLASRAAMRHVRRAFHQPDVRGSDHCPVGADLDPAVLGRRRVGGRAGRSVSTGTAR